MTSTTHPIRPFKALSLAVALAAIAPLHSAVAADVAPTSAARSYTLAPRLAHRRIVEQHITDGACLLIGNGLGGIADHAERHVIDRAIAQHPEPRRTRHLATAIGI